MKELAAARVRWTAATPSPVLLAAARARWAVSPKRPSKDPILTATEEVQTLLKEREAYQREFGARWDVALECLQQVAPSDPQVVSWRRARARKAQKSREGIARKKKAAVAQIVRGKKAAAAEVARVEKATTLQLFREKVSAAKQRVSARRAAGLYRWEQDSAAKDDSVCES